MYAGVKALLPDSQVEGQRPGFGFINPVMQTQGQGGAMFPPVPGVPGMPPLNLSMATSSSATAGDQTGGSFVSHGINFGTANHGAAASGNALLLWGAAALAVYLFVIRK